MGTGVKRLLREAVSRNVASCSLVEIDRRFRGTSGMMMEAIRTSETSVDNHFTRQYIPEDNSEQKKRQFFSSK